MKDPFPLSPPIWLINAVQPLSDLLDLPTLPLHAHEVLIAFALYTFIGSVVSPVASSWVCPNRYKALNRRTRINWDVHVVSFVQSVLISAMSLYVIFYDEQRKESRASDQWQNRVWEYTGMGGLNQSFALGYFLWDFIMCSWHVEIFGVGMLAHAISALSVFALGYRPFIYFYAPVFLLYELSSPFLNVHWFCDKLDLTGSSIQAINGIFLTSTFFACRIIWGNISSFWVFRDVFSAVFSANPTIPGIDSGVPKHYSALELLAIATDEQGQRLAFVEGHQVPLWLGLIYLASNLTLNSLNIFWFSKMVATIRKRFGPPLGTKDTVKDASHREAERKEKVTHAIAPQPHSDTSASLRARGSVKAASERTEAALGESTTGNEDARIQRAVLAVGSQRVEISGQRTLRTRRKA